MMRLQKQLALIEIHEIAVPEVHASLHQSHIHGVQMHYTDGIIVN